MATPTPRARAEVKYVRRAVEWAARALELSDVEVGSALGASPRSVARWRVASHRPSDRHLRAAERLLQLAQAVDSVFQKDMDRLHDWLHEPLPALRGRTPLRAIIDGKIDEVLTILANLDSGAFA